MAIPNQSKFVIIGAGIHGLSTAWHLATELKAQGKGSGKDVIVLDKTAIGAGASGIACGVIRNNYYQPAMQELIAHSVVIWEEDAEGYGFHPVGYMQLSPESMHGDVAEIYQRQKDIGYDSEFIEGTKDSRQYMKGILEDWQAEGITSVLHEKRGGYAHNTKALYRLADKAEAEGVRIITGCEVTGAKIAHNAVTAIETKKGVIDCDYLVVGAGPWAKRFWEMLELPQQIAIKSRDGKTHDGLPMWTFWFLQEGTLGVAPTYGLDNRGQLPPVIHVDSDAPLRSAEDDSLITDQMWGIYYKPDFHFRGVQGGSMPEVIGTGRVAVDPYGIDSEEFGATPDFAHMWTSALAHCQKRYEDTYPRYRKENSGGLGAFTPDNFPVFDRFYDNCHLILDSNHGYKMIGVGKLVAKEALGEKQALLEPFRFDRYEKGRLHPESHSPFPWS